MGIVLRLLGIVLTAAVAAAMIRARTGHRDYAILDLHASASAAEIQQGYRDLVQVWHPDRFAHNPRLQRKAQAQMQALNAAYARLCAGKAGETRA